MVVACNKAPRRFQYSSGVASAKGPGLTGHRIVLRLHLFSVLRRCFGKGPRYNWAPDGTNLLSEVDLPELLEWLYFIGGVLFYSW